ncbi:MAG: peptidoglycan DD-metalloendopeptidase family protein [Parcubacteria group bacterium]
MQKIKNKKGKIFWSFFLVSVFGLAFFILQQNKARAIECDQLTGENKDKCEALDKKAKAYEDLIEIKNKQQNTLEKQLALIDADQERTRTQLEQSKLKVEELSKQVNNMQQEVEYKESLIKYQQLILAGLMQNYYENKQEGILNIVLISKNFSDILSKADYVEQSSDRVNEALEAIQKSKAELQKEYDVIKQKKEETDSLKKDLQGKSYNLQASEVQKQVLLTQTNGEEQKYQDLLAKVREQQEQIAAEINEIEAGKSGQDLGPLPPAKSGLLAYPVNPVVITQNYGKTSFSSNYASGKHNGIDFGVKYKNVFAAKDGTVLATGNNGKYAYGRWVAIDHGNGLVTLYGHFSKVSVSKGEKVKGGEVIGVSGNTGFSTGPHLHFTVFARKTFEIVESTKVSGLMLPIGASLNPKNYL